MEQLFMMFMSFVSFVVIGSVCFVYAYDFVTQLIKELRR